MIRLITSIIVLSSLVFAGEWRVDSDFPGGSAEVKRMDATRGILRIVPRQTAGLGWRSWWYFKLTGLEPGTTVQLDVNGDLWSKPDQAWYSLDNQTWQPVSSGHFAWRWRRYRQTVEVGTVWFAHSPPYTQEHLKTLIRDLGTKVEVESLCTTRGGRTTPLLVFPALSAKGVRSVWVMA
ncbi:MAG: M14-type cytosolic carboxypeptidase, partial [Planctomycetota bacterium]